MATLETQYKNWLKENEPIEYSEWLEKFSEIHHLDKLKEPTRINMETKCTCERPDDNTCEYCEKQSSIQILREAAKDFVLSHDFSELTNPNHLANRCFQFGAKWQSERMYSEEDMSEAHFQGWVTRERFEDLSPDIIYPKGLDYEEKREYAFNLWFNKFKKK